MSVSESGASVRVCPGLLACFPCKVVKHTPTGHVHTCMVDVFEMLIKCVTGRLSVWAQQIPSNVQMFLDK